jgi:hypothetical protein
MEIPKKTGRVNSDESFNHQVRLNEEKTIKFARVREILGGYNAQELLEILVDNAIKEYDDGETPSNKFLPKQLRDGGNNND